MTSRDQISSLLPWSAVVLAAGLALLPVLYLIEAVFTGSSGEALQLLWSKSTLWLILRSLGLAAAVSLTSVSLGLVLAVCTTLTDLGGRRLLHAAVVAPLAVPCYVGASAYLMAFSVRGPLGQIMEGIGLRPLQLSGFFAAVFILTLFSFPLAYLPIRGALRRVDASTWEAARVLGEGPWGAFRAGVWPALRPACVAGGTLTALYSLGEFGAVALLRFDSFPRVIYLQFQSAFDRTAAALSSLLLIGAIVLVLFISERALRHLPEAPERARPLFLPLGRLRPAAALLGGTVAFLGIGVPLLALLYWVRDHPGDLGSWLPRATLTSVGSGAVAAFFCLILGLGLAWLTVRRPSGLGRLLVRGVDVGFALPGLVVALGLTFFTLNSVPGLYQTWIMITLAYVILFLSLAVASLRAVLHRISPRLEEAARILGESAGGAFRRVTLPLLRPGLMAGGLLVWLSVMKELSATLLLIPAGESTLATRLWSFTDEGMFAEASLPGLLLIFIAATAAFGVSRHEEASA